MSYVAIWFRVFILDLSIFFKKESASMVYVINTQPYYKLRDNF